MYHYEIPLLEMKLENIILYFGTNQTPYKSGTNILKDLIALNDFIMDKLGNLRKFKNITRTSPAVHSDKESSKKNDETFTNRLK